MVSQRVNEIPSLSPILFYRDCVGLCFHSINAFSGEPEKRCIFGYRGLRRSTGDGFTAAGHKPINSPRHPHGEPRALQSSQRWEPHPQAVQIAIYLTCTWLIRNDS